MKKILLFFSLGCCFFETHAQDMNTIDSVSLLFMGDIMGHDDQILAAYDSTSNTYDYSNVFEKISPILKSTDFTIANLEVTLSGPPYKGYPKFSSPDNLVVACKQAGINVLVTANNHSNDRGTNGIIRTINVLDSLQIKHTGTFRTNAERDSTNLLVLTKNTIKLGVLNYTYGTNRKINDYPAIVNKIDTTLMLKDIIESKQHNLDKLIVVLHWGKEYMAKPNEYQNTIAHFLYSNGVDIIIGAHPHVIQPMAYYPKTILTNEIFIAYSLGNFVSNQRKRKRDGGAMVQLNLVKKEGETSISNKGYYLNWVYKDERGVKTSFQILSCTDFEKTTNTMLGNKAKVAIKVFTDDSRKLLNSTNQYVKELEYSSVQE